MGKEETSKFTPGRIRLPPGSAVTKVMVIMVTNHF